MEALEGRQLLANGVGPAHEILVTRGLNPPMIYRGPDPGPIHNEVGNGYAVKVPRFYAWYYGDKRAELNAASLQALISPDGSSLLLSGEMAGQIPTTTAPGTTDYYFFGINRGGATGPNTFPGRTNIKFDAVVAVEINSTGVQAVVDDLDTGAITPLPSSALTIKADTIHLIVPLSQLPSTGAPASQYQVNLFTADGLPTSYKNIASFVPEFRSITVRSAVVYPSTFE